MRIPYRKSVIHQSWNSVLRVNLNICGGPSEFCLTQLQLLELSRLPHDRDPMLRCSKDPFHWKENMLVGRPEINKIHLKFIYIHTYIYIWVQWRPLKSISVMKQIFSLAIRCRLTTCRLLGASKISHHKWKQTFNKVVSGDVYIDLIFLQIYLVVLFLMLLGSKLFQQWPLQIPY